MKRWRALLEKKRFVRGYPLAVFTVLPLLLILPGLGSGRTLFGSDMILGSFHIRGLLGQLLREGRLPVWDPHAMCGYPLLAAMQAGVLYPLTWPVVFLDPGPFWTATVYVHLVLAGTFAYGWLRRGLGVGLGAGVVGACIFMLSGYYLARVEAGHLSQICTYPWLAALLWRSERLLAAPSLKRWLLMALTVPLLILPGFPQFAFFGALLMLVRLAAFALRTRREGLRTLGLTVSSGIAGGLLAAPQLLPTLEMLPEVQRVSGLSYEFATQNSIPWAFLINLVAPDFFGDDAGAVYWGRSAIWEVTGYVGITGLCFGLLALGGKHPQRYFWAAAAGVSLLLAPGVYSPVFKLFHDLVPGAALFRAPGRYLTFFTLGFSALAALGFDRWRGEGAELRKPAARMAIAGLGVLGVVVLALLVWRPGEAWRRLVATELAHPESLVSESARRDPDLPEKAARQAKASLSRAALFLGILSAGLLAFSLGRMEALAVSAVLGGLLVAELLLFGRGFFRGYDSGLIVWPEDFVRFVKERPGYPCRIASPGVQNVPLIGKCQMAGLDHVAGYESMVLRRYCELINGVSGRSPDRVRIASSVDRPHPVLDMLGTRLWLLPEGARVPGGWTALGKVHTGTSDLMVLESPQAFPRAFVVPRAEVLPSRAERLARMVDPKLDFKQVVVLEEEPPSGRGSGERHPGTARIASFAAGAYDLVTETSSPGFLVLTEAGYPGWEASVDGVPVGILSANHCVQAISLPPGRHQVRFRYRSTWLGAGFFLSAAVGIATVVVWLLRRRRSGNGAMAAA